MRRRGEVVLSSVKSRPPRMQWMDFLRGLSVLLVVVLHANTPDIAGDSLGWWTEVNLHLTPFRMPLLMFMSGMLLSRSLAKPLPVYIWGKIAAIAWPLVVWMFLYGAFVREGIGVPNDLIGYVVTGDYLWFLMSLLLCYGAAMVFKPLLARFPAGHSWGYLVVFVAMIGTYVSTTAVHGGLIGSTFWYGAFFFLGAWAAPQVQRWVKVPWLGILPLLVLTAFLANMGVSDQNLRLGSVTAAAISVMGIAVILWLAPRLPRRGIVQFVEWCGRSSIVVYVAHFPIIILLRDHVLSGLGLSSGLYVLLMTVISLALTVLMVAARPWTSWLYVFPGAARMSQRLLR